MYLQHFGLKHDPLGKAIKQSVPQQQFNLLKQKLDALLSTKGIGLITGDAGTGKTTALRQWCQSINPLTHKMIYQSDNHFRPFDIYSQFADSLGLDKFYRYSILWRKLKSQLLDLYDNKQLTPIWILDEAHQLPANFLLELPSFLNFSFDTRDILIVILVGTPQINYIFSRQTFSPLSSRILFNFHWAAIEDFEQFSTFILSAFKQAGKNEVIFSSSGLKLIHMASKGRVRLAHKVLTQCLQLATLQGLNHIPDDVIDQVINELKSFAS